MLVVDASVVGKLIFDEPGSDAAQRLIADEDVLGPPLLRFELCNLIRRAARRRGWTPETVHMALHEFFQNVAFEPDGPEIGHMALAHAMDLDHTAQDCAYLAVASLRGLPLVTADAAFARKARAKGHDVRVL